MATTQNALTDFSNTLSGLVERVGRSIVSIRAPRSLSSGFVWRSRLVVTADDALPEGEFAVVLPGGTEVTASVAGRDPTTDIALLRLEARDLPPASFAPSASGAGGLALIVGAEEGVATAALGAVAKSGGPWQSQRGGDIAARIELDVRMRQSAQGGLAVDAAGQAIGMAVFGPRQRVLVISSATLERVATRLERDGRIARGYLGLGLQTVETDSEKTGLIIMSVDPKGPAAAAGIHQGDIIVSLGGQPANDLRSVLRSLGTDSVGTTIELELIRSGKPTRAVLTIAEKPLR